jgi:hypothetical protein
MQHRILTVQQGFGEKRHPDVRRVAIAAVAVETGWGDAHQRHGKAVDDQAAAHQGTIEAGTSPARRDNS